MFCFLVICFLFQVVNLRYISEDEMTTETVFSERGDIGDEEVSSNYEFGLTLTDFPERMWIGTDQVDSNLLKLANIPQDFPDIQNILNDDELHTLMKSQERMRNIQDFLDRIKSDIQVDTVTVVMPDILNEQENPIYVLRRIMTLLFCIMTLTLVVIVTLKRRKALKEPRVFVIRSNLKKCEPLSSV